VATSNRKRRCTDDTILYLLQNCVNLQRLDLSACTQLTDETLQHCKFLGENLLQIDLSWCTGVGESALLSLVRRHSTLQSLKLRRHEDRPLSPGFIDLLQRTAPPHLQVSDV
jgi:hypothetical protein